MRIVMTISIIALLSAFPARAQEGHTSVALPVSVTLVQCGSREDIEQACAKDDRCCVFVDDFTSPETSLRPERGRPVITENSNAPGSDYARTAQQREPAE